MASMPITPDIPAAEVAIVEMTNAFRKQHKLAAVRPNARLEAAARAYAQVLARGRDLSHTLQGTTPATRAQKAGYGYCQIAENLAMASDSRGFSARDYADRAVRGWQRSPGHRRNLLLPHLTDIGVAVVRAAPDDPRYIAVQLFGRPESLRYAFKVRNVGKRAGRLRVRRQALRPRARAIQGAHGLPAARHQRVRQRQEQGDGAL